MKSFRILAATAVATCLMSVAAFAADATGSWKWTQMGRQGGTPQEITAKLTAGLDQAVADGTITEERAAKAKEHLDQVVDRILDADGHRLGQGGGGRLRERLRDRFGN